MTELFINQKLNQLLEVDYDNFPENPLEMVDDSLKFFIETDNVVADLINEIFDGDNEAYQVEHDKYHNASDLFEGLSKIAEKQGQLIYPINKYEHSQVKYYLGTDQGWDCGIAGFVVVDLKHYKQSYGLDDKTEIENNLDDILDGFTNYANGYVYCANTYQLNSKGEISDEMDCMNNISPDKANVEYLFEAGLLEGDLEDWKEATTRVYTSYVLAD